MYTTAPYVGNLKTMQQHRTMLSNWHWQYTNFFDPLVKSYILTLWSQSKLSRADKLFTASEKYRWQQLTRWQSQSGWQLRSDMVAWNSQLIYPCWDLSREHCRSHPQGIEHRSQPPKHLCQGAVKWRQILHPVGLAQGNNPESTNAISSYSHKLVLFHWQTCTRTRLFRFQGSLSFSLFWLSLPSKFTHSLHFFFEICMLISVQSYVSQSFHERMYLWMWRIIVHNLWSPVYWFLTK